jgi:hypothetical protein
MDDDYVLDWTSVIKACNAGNFNTTPQVVYKDGKPLLVSEATPEELATYGHGFAISPDGHDDEG